MTVHFQSLASGSSGNCLNLWNGEASLLVDFGLGSMKKSRWALEGAAGGAGRVNAVLVTHLHSDHIRSYPLRVLAEHGLPVWVHEGSAGPLLERHFRRRDPDTLNLRTFSHARFRIGVFEVEPFPVSHHPALPTFGFVVRWPEGGRRVKAVIVSDFNSYRGLGRRFVNADFLYVESNHDPDLLRVRPNFNSRYHLSNPDAAELLVLTCKHSLRPPSTVVLGHLSRERNEPDLAVREVRRAFAAREQTPAFELRVAHRDRPSEPVAIS